MAQASDAVWLPVLPSMKEFGPALIKGAGSEADKAGDSVGKRFGKGLAAGAAAAAGAIAAAGGALYKVGAVFDEVTDTIRVGTGATGEALDGLVASAKNVGATVPVEFDKIGPVVADLNTRLGLSGETLEKVSSQYLEAGRILGEDVDINATTAAFSAFGVEGAAVEGAMDSLFRVAQSTGIGMNELAGIVQSSAPAMQNLGFSFNETAALAGTLDKAGLNTQQVMNSMSKGLVTLAKAGEEPQEAFRRTVTEIQGFIAAGDTAGAIDLAGKVFGTKGATQFIGALQSGKVNLDELEAAAAGTGDTILGVGKETADFAEQWQLFKNRILVWLEPMGSAVFGAMGTAMAEVNGAVLAFGNAWKSSEADITSSGLPGFMERVAQGVQGLMSLFVDGDFTSKFRVAFGVEEDHPLVGFLFTLRENAIAAFNSLRPVFDVIAASLPQLGAAFGPLIGHVLQLVVALSPLGLLFKVIAPVLPQIVQMFAQLAMTVADVLGAVLPLASSLVGALVPVIVNLVSAILPPVIDTFMAIVSAIQPVIDVILAVLIPAIQFLMPIVTFAFEVIANVIKVALGIALAVITGLVGFIRDVVAPVVLWLWRNIIEPAFNAIGDTITWVWENVISPALKGFQWFLDNILGPAINWLWQNVIKPAFDGIGSTIQWVWENVIKPVFDFLAKAVEKDIPAAFEAGKKFIDDIWRGIQDVVKAPIKFVVQTVLNDGLIEAFNTVARFLGMGEIGKIGLPPGFADGGYTGNGGKYQPAGIVHAGEFVFTKEQTARLGVGNLYALARGYADGGFVDPLRGGLNLTQGYNRTHKGIDLAAAVGTPVFAANSGVVTLAGPGAQAPGVWGGNEVHILGNGIETWYAHLSQIGVRLGDIVRAGQQIALSGNTGISSGPHLHFGVFQGGWPNDLDPGGFLSGVQADGGAFNPISGLVDVLMAKLKDAFPAGGFMIDLVGGVAKNIINSVADFVTGGFTAPDGSTGAATGPVLLRDQGGVLPEGLSAVLNKTGGPEWVFNRSQLDKLNSAVSGGAFEGNLYLDSGEFLGKVRGVARSEVDAGFRDASMRRRG